MYSEFTTDKGTVRVSQTVIAKVVSETVMSSYGVVGLSYRNAADGLNTLLNKDKMFKGVRLSQVDDRVKVDLDVVLEYGVSIPTIISNLVETIIYRTENITGIEVESVNIYVQGIRL